MQLQSANNALKDWVMQAQDGVIDAAVKAAHYKRCSLG